MERSIAIPALCLVAGLANGINIANAIQQDSGSSEQQVESVQLENEQLHNQLSVNSRLVTRLVLNNSNKTFTFESVNAESQSEICKGQYRTGKNSSATAIGKLACTVDMPVK